MTSALKVNKHGLVELNISGTSATEIPTGLYNFIRVEGMSFKGQGNDSDQHFFRLTKSPVVFVCSINQQMYSPATDLN